MSLILLDEIARANALHEAAQSTAATAKDLAERACQLAVVLGLRLQRLKDSTPHGEWEPLFDPKSVTSDRFAFSVETAKRYIRAARGALDRPGLPAAARKRILAFASESLDPVSVAALPSGLDQDLAAATAGQTLRQLYLDLGIVRASAAEIGGGGARPRSAEVEPAHAPVDVSRDTLECVLAHLGKADRFLRDPVTVGLMRREHVKLIDDMIAAWRAELKTYLG
jgi:hypothetical protein